MYWTLIRTIADKQLQAGQTLLRTHYELKPYLLHNKISLWKTIRYNTIQYNLRRFCYELLALCLILKSETTKIELGIQM